MKEPLEKCYQKYNDIQYSRTDPIQLLYTFEQPMERELAALIRSCIAYGRVQSILNSTDNLLKSSEK